MPISRKRLMASLTSSTKMRQSFGSAMPSPVWSMSRYTASGGLNRPPFGPTVRMVQKSASGFDVAPAPRTPGTPKRPFTAIVTLAPDWCALMVAAVAAPPPPTMRTSVSYFFMALLHHHAAAHVQRLARDSARFGRHQED